jgi:hypothetical protein
VHPNGCRASSEERHIVVGVESTLREEAAMWRQSRRSAIVLAGGIVAASPIALPAAGQARLPPEDDGSAYTWPGATTVTVNVEP